MRVVIVEDQVLLREGLARLFQDGGHHVVSSLGDAQELDRLVCETRPDLVVLDVRMPPTFTDEGTKAARALKQAHPNLGVLVLSQHIETTHAIDLVTYAGFGYLLKDRVLAVEEFLATAQRIAAGGSALDPEVVSRLLARHPHTPIETLTDRELEVLALMAAGLTNAGIAERLFISERTVETHVRHVITKLDIPEDAHGHRRVLAVLAHLRQAE